MLRPFEEVIIERGMDSDDLIRGTTGNFDKVAERESQLADYSDVDNILNWQEPIRLRGSIMRFR